MVVSLSCSAPDACWQVATVRKSATYENASDQFRYPTEREVRSLSSSCAVLILLVQFTQQFAGLYFARLETLRPRIVQEAKRVGCMLAHLSSLHNRPLLVLECPRRFKNVSSAPRRERSGWCQHASCGQWK